MLTLGVFGLIISYVALAALLLSLNIVSLWRWWVKALAVLTMTGFYATSYLWISSMLGWPAASAPPSNFQLLSSTIVEPDRATGEGGAIYLWIRELGEDNTPVGAPRAYQIGFDDRLARDVASAQREIEAGREMMGTAGQMQQTEGESTERKELGNVTESSDVSSTDDTVPFQNSGSYSFEPLPPATLPEKPPL